MRLGILGRLGVALGLVALAVGSPNLADAQPALGRPQPKVVVYQPPTESAAVIGVLGEVQRPGSYRLPAVPTLRKLIDTCGGPTADASPMVRVVRGRRVVQRVAAHAAAEDVLQTGDLIIVDRLPQVGNVVQSSSDPGVQLAFLGVADHPVIVKVRTEQARPDLIVQMLGQSPDVLRSVQFIPPPQNQGASTGLLSDGTVLLFDPRRIVPSELKDLPEIIPCSQPEQPDIGAYGIRNAYEERQARQASSAGDQGPQLPTPFPPRFETAPPPPEFGAGLPTPQLPRSNNDLSATLSSSASAGSARPPVTRLPFSGSAPIHARNSRLRDNLPSTESEIAAERSEPKRKQAIHRDKSRSAITELDDVDADLDEEENAGSGSLSLWQMLAAIACAGLLVGVALALRSLQGRPIAINKEPQPVRSAHDPSLTVHESHAFERRAPMPTPHMPVSRDAPRSAPQRVAANPEEPLTLRQQRFTQLLNHELTRTEEPLALPPQLVWSTNDAGEIDSQPAPVSRDAPRSAPQRGAADHVAAASIRQFDPPHGPGVPAPHHRAAHEAPVERALRQLQGGHP